MKKLLPLALLLFATNTFAADSKPNIVYVLCDDLGYGDVRCFNPEGKIATPHMDRLAKSGMMFTDVHSGSAVCSPTRYGVLTGRYSWRSRLQRGVLGGLSPRLIEPGRLTVPALLKQHGYHTACVGKWHLGMNWVKLPGKQVSELNIESPDQVRNVDYGQPITDGPNAVGFDDYYGISASLDMVPYAYIENNRVTVLPTEERVFPLMLGRSGGMTRKGPTAPGFDVADVLPDLTEKAVEYIARRAEAAKQGQPFFLYLPLASPHTPIAPTAEWQGKSGLNFYADFVMQTDAGIGQVLDALDKHGLADNTLVIVTSDNGCSPQAKYDELLAKGHNPSHVFRGHKADIFEGGHRVPFVVRWPGVVQPGARSDELLCLTDLLATCAEIVGAKLPDSAGEDSVSFLPVLARSGIRENSVAPTSNREIQKEPAPSEFSRIPLPDRPQREAVVHHSINGSFAIRQGPWKLVLGPDSGGWSAPRPGRDSMAGLPPVQLYDLSADIGEQTNVQDKQPEMVARLTALLERYVADGRSTPGARQPNTVRIDIWAANPQARPAGRGSR
jgi:arylsulfatase A-like enzyme